MFSFFRFLLEDGVMEDEKVLVVGILEMVIDLKEIGIEIEKMVLDTILKLMDVVFLIIMRMVNEMNL